MRISNLIFKLLITSLFSLVVISCGGKESFDQFDSLSKDSVIPSGSIIITSNTNGTTGPGIISVWTPQGQLDRVIYDYTKVITGYASGIALLPQGNILAVSDSGGNASNDFLDLFNYQTPFASPINLFSFLSSGAAATYTRQLAVVTDSVQNSYYAFVAEAGLSRIARLSSNISITPGGFNFTRDFNFVANGGCTLATPYGVTHIPGTNNLGIVSSAASGRINVFDINGNCIGSTAMTNFPTGIAYHALSGKLLVTYFGNSSIMAHDPSTGAANPATALYTSTSQMLGPRAIATDGAGYIYVGSDGLDQVIKLYWDGVSATATYIGVAVRTSVFTQNITSITVVP